MTVLSVAIVDDVPLARQRLLRLLAAEPGFVVVGEAGDVAAARALLRAQAPDVVLLDVELPDGDGFDVLRGLSAERRPAVVFVTAHDDHAVRAFDAHAVDYVLKPVDPERLAEALRRAAARRHAATAEPALLLRDGANVELVAPGAIDWIEAAGNYACVRTAGRTIVHRGTLQALVERLDPARFVRIHRSRVVNVARVRRVVPLASGDATVELADGTALGVSRTHREALAAALDRDAPLP